MTKKYIFTILLTLFLISPAASSRDIPHRKNNPEQLHSARVAFFTCTMDLSQQEAEVFWPLYNKYSEDWHKANRNTREKYMQLKKLTQDEKTPEIELRKAVNDYLESFKVENEIKNLYLPEFYKILPADKVAKIFVAEEEFRMEMIKIWRND